MFFRGVGLNHQPIPVYHVLSISHYQITWLILGVHSWIPPYVFFNSWDVDPQSLKKMVHGADGLKATTCWSQNWIWIRGCPIQMLHVFLTVFSGEMV